MRYMTLNEHFINLISWHDQLAQRRASRSFRTPIVTRTRPVFGGMGCGRWWRYILQSPFASVCVSVYAGPQHAARQ